MLQFCFKILVLPPYREIRSDPEPDPKYPDKSDPDPEKMRAGNRFKKKLQYCGGLHSHLEGRLPHQKFVCEDSQ